MTGPSRNQDGAPGLSAHSSIDSIRGLYDRWARVYDWNPVLALVRSARRAAVRRMQLSPGDSVVDMGTGTGANLPFLREAVGPRGQVIGVDVSPGMLERARRRVEAAGWRNVTLVEGDIREPPIDGPVDGLLSAFVVVMYADPGRLIETWAGSLDQGVMAHLYAGRSTRSSAPVVNRLLDGYLRLFEEGWDTTSEGTRPLDVIAARGERVRTAMREHADRLDHDDLVFGLAQLDVGRFGR